MLVEVVVVALFASVPIGSIDDVVVVDDDDDDDDEVLWLKLC